jgi:hypothetical protein
MNLDRVEKIAEAVLYEGYMLYPYRASAIKNQQRWNFGVLCPRSYSESQDGSEAWSMQTECILQGDSATRLDVRIRFLQIVNRIIGRLTRPLRELPEDSRIDFEIVDRLEVGGQMFMPWQEAVEREATVPQLPIVATSGNQRSSFEFPAARTFEPLRDDSDLIVGVIVRDRETLSGSIAIDSRPGPDAIKVTVRIHNVTSYDPATHSGRADALMHSLVAAHTILELEHGQFISTLDPPESLRGLVNECRNVGTWPVLVGDERERDTMLSSPIILYDYPQIAPESPGGLFDGTEIDEILSLRILTMTEDEKREMRQSDQRAREILERTESLPPEHFMKLHGVLRGIHALPKEAP